MTAKKDRKKQRQRAKKRKMQLTSQPSGKQILLQRAQTSKYLKDTPILINPPDAEKMSDVILRFAEPLKVAYGNMTEKVISFAILVWNASLLPHDKQADAIKAIVEKLAETDRELQVHCLAYITMLLDRKQRMFAENQRFILDYHVSESSGNLHLDVVSTLVPDKETTS